MLIFVDEGKNQRNKRKEEGRVAGATSETARGVILIFIFLRYAIRFMYNTLHLICSNLDVVCFT